MLNKTSPGAGETQISIEIMRNGGHNPAGPPELQDVGAEFGAEASRTFAGGCPKD